MTEARMREDKITELRRIAAEARASGAEACCLPTADVVYLLEIARLAFEKKPDEAETRARDFANYWTVSTEGVRIR